MRRRIAALGAGSGSLLALGAVLACAPGVSSRSSNASPALAPQASPGGASELARTSACRIDDDCGYDPAGNRCGNDPRYNRQPLLVDQGVICFCDDTARTCQTLHVWPVPCEGDASCAVSVDPRPHPVPATVSRPHEHGKACADFTISTTCERTNICTMHRLACAAPR